LAFRDAFAQKTSITRLNYIFKVLRHIFKGKASIADPDGFRDKIKQLEKSNAVVKNGLKKQKSMVSTYSRSQKSGRTAQSEEEGDMN